MKSLSDAAFFRAFDALIDAGNPGLKKAAWSHAGARFERERLSLSNPRYSATLDLVTVSKSGWSLLVSKEFWRSGDDRDLIRNARWTKPLKGKRADILAWFKAEEKTLR
ncbi:MAG: hypothetical protein R3C60_08095 [Parvularculaceae bacterium]